MTTNLRDPALTHIVMCGSKDYDRYGELLEANTVGCVRQWALLLAHRQLTVRLRASLLSPVPLLGQSATSCAVSAVRSYSLLETPLLKRLALAPPPRPASTSDRLPFHPPRDPLYSEIVAVSWLVRTFEEGSPQPESGTSWLECARVSRC